MEDTAFDGAWWRFSAYEIRRGYVRPAANARLERFEPFPDFQVARNQRRRTELPHATLCNWVYRLEHGSSSAKNAESLVLDWCRRFGLLGLLFHQVLGPLPPRAGNDCGPAVTR